MTLQFLTGPRLFAAIASAFVLALFFAANAHLIWVAFASHPDCVLHPVQKGAASYSAATPSC